MPHVHPFPLLRLLGGLLLAGPLCAQDAPAPAIVSTTASATRYQRPDLATFTVQVPEEGLSSREAGQRLAARVDSVRRALTTLGIPRDSIVSARRSDWWRGRMEVVANSGCRPRRERGPDGRTCDPFTDSTFRAIDVLEVRIRDLDVLGAALDTVMGRGLTEISNVGFIATNTTASEEGALRDATEKARRHAVAIAEAAGSRLGRIVALSNQTAPAGRELFATGATTTSAEPSTRQSVRGTSIVRPWIAISMTVHARWELAPR